MRNLVILSFIALFIACLTSQASPNTFKLVEETENECTQTFEVTFKDTNSAVSVNIYTTDIDGLKTTEYKTFGTLQDVIVYFEATRVEDFFYLEIAGKKYMFERKQKGYGYAYDMLNEKDITKHNVNPLKFIVSQLKKKPAKEKAVKEDKAQNKPNGDNVIHYHQDYTKANLVVTGRR